MKLYEYSKRINRKLKDKQWDWVDEEFRRLWDALYNKREQYSGQIGGIGASPFESIYGLTCEPGLKYINILARIPRGTHTDPVNFFQGLPLTLAFTPWSFNINLTIPPLTPPFTVILGGGILGGVVPENYYGLLQGFSLPGATGGVNAVRLTLDGPHTTGGAPGSVIA